MKLPFFIAAIASLSASHAIAKDDIKATEKWTLDHPAYGQMKLVPTNKETEALVAKLSRSGGAGLLEWSGLWEPHSTFQIKVGHTKGRQTTPKAFDFVEPMVELAGASKGSTEGHSSTVKLFEGPSKPSDIKVQLIPLKGVPALNSPVKVAILSSEQEKISWDVYVRFTDQKPDYVKRAK